MDPHWILFPGTRLWASPLDPRVRPREVVAAYNEVMCTLPNQQHMDKSEFQTIPKVLCKIAAKISAKSDKPNLPNAELNQSSKVPQLAALG